MRTQAETNRATELMKEWNIRCNCGGRQYRTGCAPDCEIELAWDDAVAQAEEELFDTEEAL